MLGSACFAVGPECACWEAPRWLWGVGTLTAAVELTGTSCTNAGVRLHLFCLSLQKRRWSGDIAEILCTVSHGRALGFDPGPAALQLTEMKEDPLRKMPDPHPPPAAVPS